MKFSKFLQSKLIRPALAVRIDPGSSMMRTEGRCCPVGIFLYSIPVQRNWAHRTTGTSGDVPARENCEIVEFVRVVFWPELAAAAHAGMRGGSTAVRREAHGLPENAALLTRFVPGYGAGGVCVRQRRRRRRRHLGELVVMQKSHGINVNSAGRQNRVVISGAETSTAPVQHVERDADFDAVVGEWARQQFVGPGQPAQQGVAVGEQFAGGAGHVALLADEHSHC